MVESANVVSFLRGGEGEDDAADFRVGHEGNDEFLESLGSSTGLEGVGVAGLRPSLTLRDEALAILARMAGLCARATLASVAFAMADAIAGLAAGGFLGRHLCLAYHGRGRARRGRWQSG